MTEGAPQNFTNREIQNIVHPKPKEDFRTAIKRKVAAGIAAVTIATGAGAVSGCEYVRQINTDRETTQTETTVESSETTEQSVTVTPTETSVKVDPVVVTETTVAPTETTVAPTETDVNVELAEAPEISGLSKEIENGKVVYKAVEGNEYGIEAGEFAGEYNANVSVEGSRVGGVILEPEVITKIMGDKSEIIPPLDITGVTAETGLNIVNTVDSFYTEFTNQEYNTIMIEFNGQLELINPFVEGNQFNTLDEIKTDLEYTKDDGTIVNFKNQVGLIPFLAINAKYDERTKMGMEDYFYAFDVENTDKMNNFNEDKIYKKGEKTGVSVKSGLVVYYDFFNFGETTTENLARTEEGAVIFAYPQEVTVVVETKN